MIELNPNGVYLIGGTPVPAGSARTLPNPPPPPGQAREKTISMRILRAHDTSEGPSPIMRLRFDALASHDITYVGILQTARASGLERISVPYAMTNCHNSLCAVGGTINEDDHFFGLSAAVKYGAVFVPANLAVLHSYVRETMTRSGGMLLGSDSHTRYGALGMMGVGEGGPELVKQLLGDTYEISPPETVLVWMTGSLRPGAGPHDVALALVGAAFPGGFAKNKVLEFAGPGVAGLSVDTRNAIDVMTTETACLSSVWQTDNAVRDYYAVHGRPGDYAELVPGEGAYYDSMIRVDLSSVEPMIAFPFHPSNAWPISSFLEDPAQVIASVARDAAESFPGLSLDLGANFSGGAFHVQQGVIGGCSGGTFESIMGARAILAGHSTGNGYFQLSVYPGSSPIQLELFRNGAAADLAAAGAVLKPAFCGPCFGAGDVPANGTLSVRHTTRNFPSRDGSVPSQGQITGTALMDALSIAATALNGGRLTSAFDVDIPETDMTYRYDPSAYDKRIYNGFSSPKPDEALIYGPNIADWPKMEPLKENLLVRLASVIRDPVTTTDELIPSGETSSYRSNPEKLASFALSRRDPGYVGRALEVRDAVRAAGADGTPPEALEALKLFGALDGASSLSVGTAIFACSPGDGSAREQAASCQKVLGGWANFCHEFATKRYRSNCVNWGLVPFTVPEDEAAAFEEGEWIYVPGILAAVTGGLDELEGFAAGKGGARSVHLRFGPLTQEEREILACGCLMNHYAKKTGK